MGRSLFGPTNESSVSNDKRRLNFIDSLRGFAALYVVLFHMVLVPIHKLQIPEYLRGFIWDGGSGVTLFFIISAFTLCYTLDGKNSNRGYIFRFYTRRFFRIVPFYLLWLFLVLIFFDGWPGYKPFLTYLTLTFNFLPYKQEGIVWASWTLAIEVVFYFFFPFIFKYINNIKQSLVFLIISIALMIVHYNITKNINGYKTHIGILNQLPVFSIGILLYFVFKRIESWTKNKKFGYCLIVFSFCLFWFSKELFGWLGYASFLGHAFSYSVLFLGLFICPIQLFVNKITIFFGEISYSLYLNHPRIVFAMAAIYSLIDKRVNQQETSLLISFLTTLLLLVPLSYLTYILIERPSINFAKHLLSDKGKNIGKTHPLKQEPY